MLLAETMISPQPRVEDVQALTLLLFWPDEALGPNISWRICGWTTHAALELRLHRCFSLAHCDHARLRKEQVSIALATWMACYSSSVRCVPIVFLRNHLADLDLGWAGSTT